MLDEKLETIADKVEGLIRKDLKPSDDCYHRVYLKALTRILKHRADRRSKSCTTGN